MRYVVSVKDKTLEPVVRFVAESKLPMPMGTFTMAGFEETATGKEHVALVYGDISGDEPVLARIHSECLTGDALFSLRCDCGFQLREALTRIAEQGRGIILYLRQEGRGIGLLNKIKAYNLQDQGADTVQANESLGFDADLREYSMCLPMLTHFGITRLRLMTNNPRKVAAMQAHGIEISEREPIKVGKNSHNEDYLATKASKLGHILDSD